MTDGRKASASPRAVSKRSTQCPALTSVLSIPRFPPSRFPRGSLAARLQRVSSHALLENIGAEHRIREEEHAEVTCRDGAQPRTAFGAADRIEESKDRRRQRRREAASREATRPRGPKGADSPQRGGAAEESVGEGELTKSSLAR